MATILVGTSGYSYTEWIGPVYPQGTRPEAFLSLYAGLFASVELNFSYYRMPTAPQLSFSIKAHESLTHTVDPATWRTAAETFIRAMAPLCEAKRLEAVLLQFPYSFHYDVDRRKYLDALLKDFSSLPLAVEFRNAQWYNNRVFDSLRTRGVALTSVDLPALNGLPPVLDVTTSKLAYIRLHGRNSETWWGSDAAARYDYLYSEKELQAWVERVRGIASEAGRVLVYFNNHRRGQAVQNAKMLLGLLKRSALTP
jgi:uncharacterized protein YecE (DUF72 family)